MANPSDVIEKILYAEGSEANANNAYGLQDNFLATYANIIGRKYTKDEVQRAGKPLAKQILQKVYYGKGFDKFQNKEVSEFLFDMWFQNKRIYLSVVCALTQNQNQFGQMLDRDKPTIDIIVQDVNNSDPEAFLGAALWLRRRLSRMYWKSTNWKGFDQKRFSQYNHQLSCFPKSTPGLTDTLFSATDMLFNYKFYWQNKGKEFTTNQLWDKMKNINLPYDQVLNDGIGGQRYVIVACDAPPSIAPPEKNNIALPLFLGITALFLLNR